LFIHSFFQSYILHSLIHSFVHSSFVLSLSIVHSFIHAFIHSTFRCIRCLSSPSISIKYISNEEACCWYSLNESINESMNESIIHLFHHPIITFVRSLNHLLLLFIFRSFVSRWWLGEMSHLREESVSTGKNMYNHSIDLFIYQLIIILLIFIESNV